MTPPVRGNGSARDACDLSVVIVSWNVRELLRQCVRAVLDTRSGLDAEIIVVDNAGSDGSVEMIRREFPDVRIVALAKNIGFAAGNNRGIALSRGRHVLALNPDVIVGPGALATMVAKLDRDAAVGALGARQLDERGRVRRAGRTLPTFAAMLGQYTLLRVVPYFRDALDRYKMRTFGWDREHCVEVLGGGTLMTRRSVLEQLGGWDERFFMFFEDVDLCHRIRRAGYRTVFLPDAEVVHYGGRSARQAPGREMMVLRSMFAYFDKHAERGRTFLFRCVFKPAYLVTVLLRLPVESLAALGQLLAGRRNRARRRLRVVRRILRFCTRDVWSLLDL